MTQLCMQGPSNAPGHSLSLGFKDAATRTPSAPSISALTAVERLGRIDIGQRGLAVSGTSMTASA